MTTKTKKMTKATFKSFVKRNLGRLYIKTKSDFDGMQDGVRAVDDDFSPALDSPKEWNYGYDLGIQGIYLVGGGRDRFRPYADGAFSGIEVHNCCGSYVVAIK